MNSHVVLYGFWKTKILLPLKGISELEKGGGLANVTGGLRWIGVCRKGLDSWKHRDFSI